MIHKDELPLLTQDKSAADIALLYEAMDDARIIFRESCRRYILDFIPDWASEDEPYECDFTTTLYNLIGEPFMETNIYGIWREREGDSEYVRFATDMDDEASIDYFRDEELLQLIEQLDKS